MANVLDQGIKPMTKKLERLVPKVEFLEGKNLAELPHIFNGFLVDLLAKEKINVENVEVDAYGNPFISLGDTRISLAIALVTKSGGICIYNRKGTELNFNDNVDIIGSVGYGIPSMFFKIPPELWSAKIKSATLAENYAWEKTDCINDKEIVKMPVLLLTVEENIFCTIKVEDIENQTSKTEVVLEHLNK